MVSSLFPNSDVTVHRRVTPSWAGGILSHRSGVLQPNLNNRTRRLTMEESAADLDKNSTGDAMTDSCLTTSQESSDGGYSDEGRDGFWPVVAQDLRALYSSVSSTAGGAVRFLQNSALSVAAEIAELERQEGELQERLRLPWEIDVETDDGAATVEDEELKSKILLISLQPSSFLEPYTVAEDFELDDPRIQLIRELLEIDPALAKTHARLSSRTSTTEALFWRNYFHQCHLVRKKYLGSQGGTEDVGKEGASILSGDDSSYVCIDGSSTGRPPSRPPSAPSSLNMLSRSTEDLVILGSPEDIPRSPTSGGRTMPQY